MSGRWVSPDGKVEKIIRKAGKYGLKPTDDAACVVNITNNASYSDEYANKSVVIGDGDTEFERLLDVCLMMMHTGEQSDVTFHAGGERIEFTLRLVSFEPSPPIYKWGAGKKYELAMKHKHRGVELYRKDHVAASRRFGKAIKLLSSIPIDVEFLPEKVDGVALSDVHGLKLNLYNNLASCYLRHGSYQQVIELCNDIIVNDGDNVKALYKLGVAYKAVRSFEDSYESFKKLLRVDPANKAARERFKEVALHVKECNKKSDDIVKKMFQL